MRVSHRPRESDQVGRPDHPARRRNSQGDRTEPEARPDRVPHRWTGRQWARGGPGSRQGVASRPRRDLPGSAGRAEVGPVPVVPRDRHVHGAHGRIVVERARDRRAGRGGHADLPGPARRRRCRPGRLQHHRKRGGCGRPTDRDGHRGMEHLRDLLRNRSGVADAARSPRRDPQRRGRRRSAAQHQPHRDRLACRKRERDRHLRRLRGRPRMPCRLPRRPRRIHPGAQRPRRQPAYRARRRSQDRQGRHRRDRRVQAQLYRPVRHPHRLGTRRCRR